MILFIRFYFFTNVCENNNCMIYKSIFFHENIPKRFAENLSRNKMSSTILGFDKNCNSYLKRKERHKKLKLLKLITTKNDNIVLDFLIYLLR